MVQQWKQLEIIWCESELYRGWFITSILWCSNHSCTRAAVCGPALTWLKIHCQRNSKSFLYHLVLLLTYPYFWRADMLIDHPSAIKEGDQPHFANWLLLMNFFHPEFATIKPCLWLAFYFRIVIMNPRFVNSDNTRENLDTGRFTPDFLNTEQWSFISLAGRNWGTHIEQTHFIPNSFVKMHRIDILVMCRLSNTFWIDVWGSSKTTTNTVLMLTSVTTVLSRPPLYLISADSLPSVNALCHLRLVVSCKV